MVVAVELEKSESLCWPPLTLLTMFKMNFVHFEGSRRGIVTGGS